jgi:nicotinamidase-related amidase
MHPELRVANVIFQVQNDFCLPGSPLCVHGAMGCLPSVIEAVNVARAHNVAVVWVVREHDPSGARCSS